MPNLALHRNGSKRDADSLVGRLNRAQVGEAFFAGSVGGAVVEDAVGEVVDLADELHGVALCAGLVELDPGRADLGRRRVVPVDVLAGVGVGVHVEKSPGPLQAVEAAHLAAVAGGAEA